MLKVFVLALNLRKVPPAYVSNTLVKAQHCNFLYKEFGMVRLTSSHYLNSRFAELRSRCQSLAGAHARIVRFVEFLFKFFQLLGTEGCSISAKFRLIAIKTRWVFSLNVCWNWIFNELSFNDELSLRTYQSTSIWRSQRVVRSWIWWSQGSGSWSGSWRSYVWHSMSTRPHVSWCWPWKAWVGMRRIKPVTGSSRKLRSGSFRRSIS